MSRTILDDRDEQIIERTLERATERANERANEGVNERANEQANAHDDIFDGMTREQLVHELKRLRDVDDERFHALSRIEGIETDNARLREGQLELAALGARYMDLYEGAPVPYVVLDEGSVIRELNPEAARLLGEEMWQLRGKPFSRFVAPKERRAFNEHVLRTTSSGYGNSNGSNSNRNGSNSNGSNSNGSNSNGSNSNGSNSNGSYSNSKIDGINGTAGSGRSARGRINAPTSSITLSLHLSTGKASIKLVSRALSRSTMDFAGVRTVLFDMTNEKRAEEELRLALRMREDFLAVVAHDLRSPLAAVVMSAELLERHATGDTRELERIRRATTRMNRLVGDLLDLSSMDAGRLAMEPALENVESLIVAALEIASPLAARKNISLSAHVDGDFVEAWCDRERIIQVLLNLITNAVKFTSSGSISVRAKRNAGEVHFVVHDTGKGLSRAQIDHIFDPYWQVSPNGREGTGLGLSIVKGIVQLHGGRVWAESRPGRGSSFSFTLPRHAPGTAPTDIPEISAPLPRPSIASLNEPSDEAGRGSRGLVMLVDDEGSVRDAISEVLRAEGYDVVAVPHGRAALDYLDRATVMPSLILLDLVMPVMDGWEFLRQQSRTPRLADVPVVLVSAQADQQQQQAQQQRQEQRLQQQQQQLRGQMLANNELPLAPLAGFIQKPVRLARLCEVVGTCAATA